MRSRDRILLAAGAPLVFLGLWWFAWVVLPGVHRCISISCGAHFDPGGLNVFGEQFFTPAQTVDVAAGIFVASFMLALALLPRNSPWTPAGMGALALAVVIALALPSPTTGPAPSIPCSTPGPHGPVSGACATGPAPVDARIRDRALVLAGGFLALGLGLGTDRRRKSERGARAPAAV